MTKTQTQNPQLSDDAKELASAQARVYDFTTKVKARVNLLELSEKLSQIDIDKSLEYLHDISSAESLKSIRFYGKRLQSCLTTTDSPISGSRLVILERIAEKLPEYRKSIDILRKYESSVQGLRELADKGMRTLFYIEDLAAEARKA